MGERFARVTERMLRPRDLSLGEFRLLVQFVFDGGSKRCCVSGAGKLAERTGLTRRGVQQILDGLERKGWVRVVKRQGQDSRIEWRTPLASEAGSLANEVRASGERRSDSVANGVRGKAVDQTARLVEGIERVSEGHEQARAAARRLGLRVNLDAFAERIGAK